MSTSAPVSVWLVEDNDSYREAVERVLGEADGLSCPAAFGSCEAALAALAGGASPPEVILMDVGLPGLSGLEGIPLIRAAAPSARIIVLTVFQDDDNIFRAICAGATGYLLKLSAMDQITSAVREVLSGGSPMNARIARRVLEMFARLAPATEDFRLTDRERSVLESMVQGLGKKQIAARLALSIHTVDSHIRNIYEKLHVHNRSAAVAKAIRKGII